MREQDRKKEEEMYFRIEAEKRATMDYETKLRDSKEKARALAEAEGHHPALLTEWGKVTVDWWTHKIHDIHLNDLILAARCDGFYDGMPGTD